MTTLPFHAIPVIINDQIRLQIYAGSRSRSGHAPAVAPGAGASCWNYALAADISTAGADRGVFKPAGEEDIAAGKRAHG